MLVERTCVICGKKYETGYDAKKDLFTTRHSIALYNDATCDHFMYDVCVDCYINLHMKFDLAKTNNKVGKDDQNGV